MILQLRRLGKAPRKSNPPRVKCMSLANVEKMLKSKTPPKKKTETTWNTPKKTDLLSNFSNFYCFVSSLSFPKALVPSKCWTSQSSVFQGDGCKSPLFGPMDFVARQYIYIYICYGIGIICKEYAFKSSSKSSKLLLLNLRDIAYHP